ncbi:hypothetical protein DID88_004844 [Monilinia fructigena]|uniref:Uncharacterized protein n=1 Tax=Monilinia fructigena TaxID=38457 RepID=A0A395IPR6_9HELO|nr:hypothetical protein DID88_004844 [Monilinia fructigena]
MDGEIAYENQGVDPPQDDGMGGMEERAHTPTHNTPTLCICICRFPNPITIFTRIPCVTSTDDPTNGRYPTPPTAFPASLSRPASGLSGNGNYGNAYQEQNSRSSGASTEQQQQRGSKNSVVIKVGMVGDAQIGKTSLMVKYVEGSWDEDYIQTLGQGRGFNKTAAIPFLVGTKYDHFVNFPREDQEEISNQARRFAKAMRASLIFSSTSHSINVQKIFKIVLSKAFDLKCTIPESKMSVNLFSFTSLSVRYPLYQIIHFILLHLQQSLLRP